MATTINLIPSNYDGDARQALGYCWADYEQRIPGDDRVFDGSAVDAYEQIFAEYRSSYGEITVTKQDGYNEMVDGQNILIDREHLVAVINGMWCGSATRYIYRGQHQPVCRIMTNVLVDDGMVERDEPEHGVNGYCRKCHSYCYGDCEASR